ADLLIDRWRIADVPGRIGVEHAAELEAAERLRVATALLEGRELRVLELLEFVGRERGLAQHFGDEPERIAEVRAHGLRGRGRARRGAAHAARRLEPVDLDVELLPLVLLRTAQQHRAGERADGRL